MPASTFAASAHGTLPPEEVWKRLQEPETWEAFGLIDEVIDPVVTDGALHSFRWMVVAAGRQHEGTAVVTVSAPPSTMSLDLTTAEMEGAIEVVLAPRDSGTAVSVTMNARSRGWLAGAFWGVISSSLERGLEDQVERFASGT